MAIAGSAAGVDQRPGDELALVIGTRVVDAFQLGAAEQEGPRPLHDRSGPEGEHPQRGIIHRLAGIADRRPGRDGRQPRAQAPDRPARPGPGPRRRACHGRDPRSPRPRIDRTRPSRRGSPRRTPSGRAPSARPPGRAMRRPGRVHPGSARRSCARTGSTAAIFWQPRQMPAQRQGVGDPIQDAPRLPPGCRPRSPAMLASTASARSLSAIPSAMRRAPGRSARDSRAAKRAR